MERAVLVVTRSRESLAKLILLLDVTIFTKKQKHSAGHKLQWSRK